MVGHTHEDIDALFGNISQWLKRNDAFTLHGTSLLIKIAKVHNSLGKAPESLLTIFGMQICSKVARMQTKE